MLLKIKGWAWGPLDFVVMWMLLAGAGFAYALLTRNTVPLAYRFATGLALVTCFLLVWINSAVGIIGSEENPANLLYAAVLFTGLIGAVIARFQSPGMSRALVATAIAQLLVPVIALLFHKHDFAPGLWQVFALNACFAALFATSAALFQRAARSSPALRETTAA
ncbi:hypothetical protein CMV30_17445 [Nibricoccus aquaticus]|uniref:Uncharacterized protein n=2 Tax=Nibricoccus aquaticus TaxID=2576891 RepID=A0A290QG53_9BACT|nr:hypothetical protein CMV30_17445 [Nibricoccus aquaticus]